MFEVKKSGGSKTEGGDLWMLSQFFFIVGMPTIAIGAIAVKVEKNAVKIVLADFLDLP
jgi:hypothetical protein